MSWGTRLRLALLVVTTVVLQTTLLSSLRIFGVMPDIGLVATAAVAYSEGPETGAIYGFANGLAIDLFLRTPLGLGALTFALVGYGVGIVQSGMLRPTRWLVPLLGALSGLAGGLMFIAIGGLVGREELLAVRSVKVLLFATAYDGVLAFAVFPVARWATRHRGHHERVERWPLLRAGRRG